MHSSRMCTVRCNRRLLGGVSVQGGVSAWGERVSAQGGCVFPGVYKSPPVDRILDTQLSLRTVKIWAG